MQIKIVTGIAGSGKSTYCKKLEAEGYKYIAHDLWVREDLEKWDGEGQKMIEALLGNEYFVKDHAMEVDRKKFVAALLEDDELNHIFIGAYDFHRHFFLY